MYIYHDRLTDNYKSFSTLQALSNNTGIPYGTLQNHFSRQQKSRYVTKEAEIIIKTDIIKTSRKITKNRKP